jgi:Peptidyl-prolyl cis-trans isomerase (rotamase) - cyclophilin family
LSLIHSLDGKYVGFGEIVEGKSVLNQIEYSGDMKGGKPKKEVVIIECGVIAQSESQ